MTTSKPEEAKHHTISEEILNAINNREYIDVQLANGGVYQVQLNADGTLAKMVHVKIP